MKALRDKYAPLIRERYPKIPRRVSGYNLDEFVKAQPFNLSRVIVGSEGTLATVVEAKMRLVPKPKWTAMDVIHFNDDIEALECAQLILQTHPYAMESTDKMVLNLARGNIEQSRRLGFVQGTPDSLLMVEYAGETEAEVCLGLARTGRVPAMRVGRRWLFPRRELEALARQAPATEARNFPGSPTATPWGPRWRFRCIWIGAGSRTRCCATTPLLRT